MACNLPTWTGRGCFTINNQNREKGEIGKKKLSTWGGGFRAISEPIIDRKPKKKNLRDKKNGATTGWKGKICQVEKNVLPAGPTATRAGHEFYVTWPKWGNTAIDQGAALRGNV